MEQMKRNPVVIILFLLPGLLVFLILVLKPIAGGFVMSMMKWTTFIKTEFVWFQNYSYLFHDELFWQSVKVSLIFMFGTTVIQIVLGFMLGYFLYLQLKGYQFFRTVLFMPSTLLAVGVGFFWGFLLSPRVGLWQHLLEVIGLSQFYKPLLGSSGTALMVVILAHVWLALGYTILLFNAGFQNMPKHILEAASIDGASGWKKLIYIIIPVSWEIDRMVIILQIVGSLRAFDLIYIMTSGGPLHGTEVLPLHMFTLAFENFQIGMGCSVAVILFAICMLFTIEIIRFTRRDALEY